MAVVSLERLSKVYDRTTAKAVDDVSLEIADGELMVLLGPSGCGKTTTLRMIAGLESISSGTLRIGGKVVNDVPAKDRDIAMVFQSYALYPHMTVKDNLAFGLRRRSIDAAEIERRVAQVADSLGLSALLGRRPHALSGGQRQRVALGRAIVRDPEVFLFDEPLSNLDAGLRASTRAELAELHHRLEATMIYVTHDQVEAMTLGDRICVMNGGKVAQVGTPIEVYQRPANLFVARFLGAPPMNIVKSAVASLNGRPVGRIGETTVPLDRFAPASLRGDVLLGFRPEAARLGDGRPSDDRPDHIAIPGSVKLVERLGAETVTTVAIATDQAKGGTDVLLRNPGDRPASFGDRVRLQIAAADLYAFDPGNGAAIPAKD